MKNRLAIVGGGDLGQQIAHYALETKKNTIVGFYDDTKEKGSILPYGKVLGTIATVEDDYTASVFDTIVIAIGYKHLNFKVKLAKRFSKIPLATIIHPSVLVDKTAVIEEGVVLFPGVLIDKNVVIKKNVVVNVHTTISHDTVINEHCFLSPRVAIAGFVEVGEQSVLGINSTIIDNITLVNETRLAGGAVVTKNIIKPGLYAGVPAHFKKP